MAQLAALVPPPRTQLTRFHGVFAPHGKLRAAVTPLHALQSTTINAADLLGVNDRGELKLGLLADITAMERVVFVMKGGEILKQ